MAGPTESSGPWNGPLLYGPSPRLVSKFSKYRTVFAFAPGHFLDPTLFMDRTENNFEDIEKKQSLENLKGNYQDFFHTDNKMWFSDLPGSVPRFLFLAPYLSWNPQKPEPRQLVPTSPLPESDDRNGNRQFVSGSLGPGLPSLNLNQLYLGSHDTKVWRTQKQ